MQTFARLPDPPVPMPMDTAEHHGLAVLAFVIRENLCCTCSDEQLELALHVAPIASAVYVSGSKDQRQVDHRTIAADCVANAKRLIMATQRARQQLAREASQQEQQQAQAQPQRPQAGPGGSRVPRVPVVPTQPPSTDAAPLRYEQPQASRQPVPDIQF